MAVQNIVLAMDSASSISQELSQFLDSGVLNDRQTMELALEQRDGLTWSNARLLRLIRDLANDLNMVAPMVPFGTGFAEIPLLYHTNSAGISIFLFHPCLEDYGNQYGSQIRPGYISDGLGTWVNESEDNLFLYLASNFSDQDQEQIFRKILIFLESNFTVQNGNGTGRISKCVKDFCGEMERIISEACE